MAAPAQNATEPQETAEVEAEYTLESPAKCPLCRTTITRVGVVRMLRTKVNFTSTLPRRGCITVCPSCRGILPAAITSLIS
jgi:hypothetical protein